MKIEILSSAMSDLMEGRWFYGYHRMLSKRFPHAIYYKLEEKPVVTVWRILDLRRDPKRIKGSLQNF